MKQDQKEQIPGNVQDIVNKILTQGDLCEDAEIATAKIDFYGINAMWQPCLDLKNAG